MKVFKLDRCDITITINEGRATIESRADGCGPGSFVDFLNYRNFVSGVHSLVLNCAERGIDVESEAFQNAVLASMNEAEESHGPKLTDTGGY